MLDKKNSYDSRPKEHIIKIMRDIEDRFDSSTICTAKWLQGTTLLYNGTTHSCHHNKRHKINYDYVQSNHTLIHNTPKKVKERELMKSSIRPDGCDYCWKFEDQGNLSDRYYKSNEIHTSLAVLDRLDSNTPLPSYLEVAFDSTCNLKCMYCSPESSSKWMEEIERHGPYLTTPHFNSLQLMEVENRVPIRQRDYNPYIEAFWKWWPELKQSLKTFRITGGEPLLSKQTWKIIDDLIEDPNLTINFSINTNLSVEDRLIDRLIDKIKILEKKVDRLVVFTSCEAYGEQAEYIRFGLKYDEFINNCDKILSNTETTGLTFMSTITSLSLFSLKDFILDVRKLQIKHGFERVLLDLPLLTYPRFQMVNVLPVEITRPYLEDLYSFIQGVGSPREIVIIKRLLDALERPLEDRDILIKNFVTYFKEYDERRGTNIVKLWPQLTYLFEEEKVKPLTSNDIRQRIRSSMKRR